MGPEVEDEKCQFGWAGDASSGCCSVIACDLGCRQKAGLSGVAGQRCPSTHSMPSSCPCRLGSSRVGCVSGQTKYQSQSDLLSSS
jgi:hypothetical protein